ncbi:MAG: hypothetical protein RLY31_1027 [Bacteroidota bacterium]|jgi:hypothetical protein
MPNEKLKVYILRPTYLEDTTSIDNAYSLVRAIEGPIEFHYVEYPEEDPQGHLIRTDRHFDPTRKQTFRPYRHKAVKPYDFTPDPKMEEMRNLRIRIAEAADWCLNRFREDPDNTLVILMSGFQNEWNYFATILPEHRNAAFVQVNHFVATNMKAPHIPIAYEFLALALRFRAFNVPEFYQRYAHQKAVGCLNDFFSFVPDMEFKVKSADICHDCKLRIKEMNVSMAFVRQVRDGLERVRRLQLNFESYLEVSEYPTIEIRRNLVVVKDLGVHIRLSPKEMAVYKVFSDHPEGIAFSHLFEYRDELFDAYRYLTTTTTDDWRQRANDLVNGLVDQTSNSLSEAVSKLNRKIQAQLGKEFGTLGQLVGEPGGKRVISRTR